MTPFEDGHLVRPKALAPGRPNRAERPQGQKKSPEPVLQPSTGREKSPSD